MEQTLKPEERELVRLIQYFKKRAEILITENKLEEDYRQMLETCNKLTEQLYQHAKYREAIITETEQLKSMIKDNAKCPTCSSNEMLKVIGFDTSPQGWKSNKYKCRRCNIAFVWNTPNNPWDMIQYIEEVLTSLRLKYADAPSLEGDKDTLSQTIENMQSNLEKLKPVIDAHNLEYSQLQSRETEMEKLIHEFKNSLLIEKIKMDTWENR